MIDLSSVMPFSKLTSLLQKLSIVNNSLIIDEDSDLLLVLCWDVGGLYLVQATAVMSS